jgi:branched-subunit amino acid ABC-type transport system permease component
MVGVIASMIDGVLVGAVYGLAAIGLTLIWGVMNVINLTHGAMIALGMFGLTLLFTHLGVQPYAALVPVALGGFVAGVVVLFAALPALGGVSLRENLFLAAVAIILASNLNLMVGHTGYVNFGNIVFFGLGGYFGVWLTTRWPRLQTLFA